MKRLCCTCEWWAADDGDRGETDRLEETGSEFGECRYNAPLMIPDEHDPYRLHAAWPSTIWNAWCRHWREVQSC